MTTPDANPFRRLVAYGIDISLLYTGLLALQFGFQILTNWAVSDWLVASGNTLLIYAWIFLTMSLPMWTYFIVFESGPGQATLGKRLLSLAVTDMAGNRLTVARATLRTAFKLAFFEIGHLSFLYPTPISEESTPSFRIGFAVLPAVMAFYFVLTLVTVRHQSVHDLVAHTLVIRRQAALPRGSSGAAAGHNR